MTGGVRWFYVVPTSPLSDLPRSSYTCHTITSAPINVAVALVLPRLGLTQLISKITILNKAVRPTSGTARYCTITIKLHGNAAGEVKTAHSSYARILC
jgi:hypothetical protein